MYSVCGRAECKVSNRKSKWRHHFTVITGEKCKNDKKMQLHLINHETKQGIDHYISKKPKKIIAQNYLLNCHDY